MQLRKGQGRCMDKIAVVGDRDSIYGFAALGLDIFPETGDLEEDKILFKKLCSRDYGIIYVTEAFNKKLKSEISEYENQVFPAIIQIPGISGNTGEGVLGVKRSVEKAVGSDILFGNE